MNLHRKIKHNKKVCCAYNFGFYAQGQGRSQVRGQNSCLQTKLQRKIEHNEKVCRAQKIGSYAQGQGHNRVRGQIVPKCFYTTKANLIKLHRKKKHDEKVCHTHVMLVPTPKVKVAIRSELKIVSQQ